MKKKIIKKNIYYDITWSRPNQCNRHTILGIPGMAGIAALFKEKGGVIKYILFYACWKSGVRNGLRDLLDPHFSQFPELIKLSEEKKLLFKYAVVDTNPKDMQDILFWLIREYDPELNDLKEFTDSKRYKDIFILENTEESESN